MARTQSLPKPPRLARAVPTCHPMLRDDMDVRPQRHRLICAQTGALGIDRIHGMN